MNGPEGKVAIVTGVGQGLGLAVARLFASEGAKVVGAGRHVEKVEKALMNQRGVSLLVQREAEREERL